MKIKSFDWDDTNVEHIARHNIVPAEVEEVFLDAMFRKGRDRRLLAYGVTEAGRFLLVVSKIKANNIARIITARDMTKAEKRYYLRHKRR